MGHDHHGQPHGCDHNHSSHGDVGKGLALAFFLNLSFAIVEVIGGLYTNSIAILSDALHDFGDASALGLAWYLEKFSGKKADRTHSYGYRRYSLLSALITSTVLVCGSIVVAWRAFDRILHPEPVKAGGMMILAIVGILVNGFAFKVTHRGHSHNEKAISLHLLEDVLGWVAVLIASIVMIFVNAPWLDPALSLAISVYILWGAIKRIRETSLVFLQTVPSDVDLVAVRSTILDVADVASVEDFHVWSTDGSQIIVTLSVRRKSPASDASTLRREISKALGNLAHHHVTIEILDSSETVHGCETL
ncbi:MAG: cation diffusion facilitator family transporter [Bdellovibrionota bacterium]